MHQIKCKLKKNVVYYFCSFSPQIQAVYDNFISINATTFPGDAIKMSVINL